ncbi:hypothetical protein [Virgibacillus salexigens]|uniref:hypothetical protein n=1 Tax=Virgibacillus salexigens TaxID=61016 RepID=UPI00190A8030|nr:hypothetical protein [Virgibacillus salexigens]
MSVGLIVFLIILFVIALGTTLFAFKQEENKLRRYEEEGDSPENERIRSSEYEVNSLKTNVPILIGIYSLAVLIGLIAFMFYIFN